MFWLIASECAFTILPFIVETNKDREIRGKMFTRYAKDYRGSRGQPG